MSERWRSGTSSKPVSTPSNPVLTATKQALRAAIEGNGNPLQVEAVYGVGGLARGASVIRDVDMNIFLRHCAGADISLLGELLRSISLAISRPVDVNLVDMAMVDRNFIGTPWFLHASRHVLFVHELQQVKCLLYGRDLLSEVYLDYSDLLPESLKLTFMQGHRLQKEHLASSQDVTGHARRRYSKYVRYAIEFAMVFAGFLNPYIGLDFSSVAAVYPDLQKWHLACIAAVNSSEEGVSFEDAMDIIDTLAHSMMGRFQHLVEFREMSPHIAFEAEHVRDSEDTFFVFPDRPTLHRFFANYDCLPDYRRIR